jgi:hypothetical protein
VQGQAIEWVKRETEVAITLTGSPAEQLKKLRIYQNRRHEKITHPAKEPHKKHKPQTAWVHLLRRAPKMKTRWLLQSKMGRACLALALVAPFLAWELFPPFARPNSYEPRSYQDVVALLGQPDEIADEKYLAWKRQRVFSFWFLRASYERGSTGEIRLSGYSRYFCVGVAAYNLKVLL